MTRGSLWRLRDVIPESERGQYAATWTLPFDGLAAVNVPMLGDFECPADGLNKLSLAISALSDAVDAMMRVNNARKSHPEITASVTTSG